MKKLLDKSIVLLIALMSWASVASAQTVMDCADQTNFACATGTDVITGAWTFDTPFAFEGATADGNETTLSIGDPSADRTLFIPNANSATATAIDCDSGQHVDAFDPATGLFTCTADSGGAHNLLSASHGDTVAAAAARGAVIVGNATPAWERRTVGAANTFLGSDGTDTNFTAISASHLGAGDLANTNVWAELCTATNGICTLASTPQSADHVLAVYHGIVLRRVTSCGGVNEYTLSGTTLTACAQTFNTGANALRLVYQL